MNYFFFEPEDPLARFTSPMIPMIKPIGTVMLINHITAPPLLESPSLHIFEPGLVASHARIIGEKATRNPHPILNTPLDDDIDGYSVT